jgi:hypothetical protein
MLQMEKYLERMNYGVTSSVLDDFLPFQDLVISEKPYYKRRTNQMAKTAHYLLNFDKLVIVNKFATAMDADQVGQKSKFRYLVLSGADNLEKLTLKILKEIQKKLGGTGAVDNKAVASARIWDFIKKLELEIMKPPEKTPAKKTVPKKDQKPSKINLIRDLFKKKKAVSREDIKTATGYDDRNAHTAMAILKNAERTKDTLLTAYDRKTKIYTLIER